MDVKVFVSRARISDDIIKMLVNACLSLMGSGKFSMPPLCYVLKVIKSLLADSWEK